MLVPILYGLGISFTNYNMSMPAHMRRYVGLANYAKVLKDQAFQNSIGWTFAFAGIAVVGTVFLAMTLALALNSPCMQGLHGRLIKTGFILPMMLCPLVVSNVWYIIFAPNYGLIHSRLSGQYILGKVFHHHRRALVGYALRNDYPAGGADYGSFRIV